MTEDGKRRRGAEKGLPDKQRLQRRWQCLALSLSSAAAHINFYKFKSIAFALTSRFY